MFLVGQAASHGSELLLGEGHAAALHARYLDEAWFGAGCNLAGELKAVTLGCFSQRTTTKLKLY